MSQRIDVHVVHVFTDKNGDFGSPTGIILDENSAIRLERRQEITVQLGFSETVFINKLSPADVSIFAQQKEIPFAGAPLVGTAWFIDNLTGSQTDVIRCQENEIKIVHDEGLTWVIAEDLSILPKWNLEQLDSEEEIEALSPDDRPPREHSYVWAWVDQSLKVGKVRARTFLPDWGIAEEEANGSGSMLLAHKLGRSLLIKHGKGSYVRATVGSTGVAVGGLVTEGPSLSV
jgi:predicted PhzF superfamily epimerase YddE/YHI9